MPFSSIFRGLDLCVGGRPHERTAHQLPTHAPAAAEIQNELQLSARNNHASGRRRLRHRAAGHIPDVPDMPDVPDTAEKFISSGPSEAALVMAMSRPAPPIPMHDEPVTSAPPPVPEIAPPLAAIAATPDDAILSKFGLREKPMPKSALALYRAVLDQMEQLCPRSDGALTERELQDQAALRKTIARGWNVPPPYLNIEERQVALSMGINLHMIANGASYCLNKEAAKMGLQRLTIVRVVDREAALLHYHSTEPR